VSAHAILHTLTLSGLFYNKAWESFLRAKRLHTARFTLVKRKRCWSDGELWEASSATGDINVLSDFERTTMEDTPAGVSRGSVDHLPGLIASKVVGNPSSPFPPLARLMQQETL